MVIGPDGTPYVAWGDDSSGDYEIYVLQWISAPDLVVTKQADPDPVRAGEQLTYTIRVTNTGDMDLHATVTDTLPTHVTPGGVLTWTPTITAPGGVWTQAVVVTAETGYAGPLTNVVQATSEEGATGIYTETTVAQLPGMLVVTSAADSGPGTLRWALQTAVASDTITFDPSVFPPGAPATITLTSGLPDLDDGNVTIDASDAGVILDGGGIGTTPETVLVDDVSLTLDGGPDLISNGDFTAGQGHWRPWDDRPGATRSITTSDYHSSPNAYAWSSVAHVGDSRTVYDTSDTSDPLDDWPYYDGSTVWITATGGSTVEIRFWYRYGRVDVGLWDLASDGQSYNRWEWRFDSAGEWTEAVASHTLPGDVVGVALELVYRHSESSTRGLEINSDGNTVRGLQIVNFPFDGIRIRDASDNVVGGDRDVGSGPLGQGNLISANGSQGIQICGGDSANNQVLGNTIGTNLSGSAPLPNVFDGVSLQCSPAPHDNVIGGLTPGTRNLVSGNGRHGIQLIEGAHHNTITGNDIGTDASGTLAVPNAGNGVQISDGASDNLVGGDTGAERNLISGNQGFGVYLWSTGTSSNTIRNNYIGTDRGGTMALPNGWSGVALQNGVQFNTVGPGNVIAHNSEHGIHVYNPDSLYNTITQNSIHDNDGMGIDLDDGGNTELATPVITGFDIGAGVVTGTTCANCTVEVFSDSTYQGQVYEGQTTADGAGGFTFSKGASLTGPHLTATATDADGNTSEFSDPAPPANTSPVLSDLPNQIFDQTTSPTSTIDLWAYAWDAQTPTDALTYTIEGAPPAGAGVTLDGNRYVTVNPSTDWCGRTDVTIRVTDPGGLWDSDIFRVAVTWSCQGPLPVAGQHALRDEPITIDLTPYEPQVGDGTGLSWYVTGEDHCTVSGEYSDDDVLTFTPQAGFAGSDTVTLRMVYPWGSEATQELTLAWGSGTCDRPGVPVLVAPVDGSAVGGNRPTFEWGAVTGAEEYQIQVDDNTDFSSPERDETTASTEYTPASGLGGGVHYWRVRASNGCGVGVWSARQEFTVFTALPLGLNLHLPVVAREYR
jgi:uncharacterized repeat protein (TIGR01451 family)